MLDKRVKPPPGETTDQVLRNFALRTFRHQPLDFLHAVFDDFAKGFALSPTTAHNDVSVGRWQFQRSYPLFPGHSAHTETEHFQRDGVGDAIPRLAERKREFYEPF